MHGDSRLIHIAKSSEAWAELMRWTDVMLDKYRAELESESMSVEETVRIRARIALLKGMKKINVEDNRDEHQ